MNGDFHSSVARAAFEATSSGELLELLLTSPYSITASASACVITTGKLGEPYLSEHKFMSQEVSASQISHQDLLDLARSSEAITWVDPDSSVAAELLKHSATGKTVFVTPLRIKGAFLGLLAVISSNPHTRDFEAEPSFVIHVVSLALAKLLQDGKGGPPKLKSQSEARMTDRQLKITEYAIRGLSNTDIAAELHLSLGTVKVELGKIYRKLEISSRSELYLPVTN